MLLVAEKLLAVARVAHCSTKGNEQFMLLLLVAFRFLLLCPPLVSIVSFAIFSVMLSVMAHTYGLGSIHIILIFIQFDLQHTQ